MCWPKLERLLVTHATELFRYKHLGLFARVVAHNVQPTEMVGKNIDETARDSFQVLTPDVHDAVHSGRMFQHAHPVVIDTDKSYPVASSWDKFATPPVHRDVAPAWREKQGKWTVPLISAVRKALPRLLWTAPVTFEQRFNVYLVETVIHCAGRQ